MLYIKDDIIKDSNLIAIETEDSIIYNPDHDTLLSNGWEVYKEKSNTKIIENKGFVKTTSEEFELLDKSQYKDSIVFVEDTKLIWNNGIYYGASDSQNSQNSIDITYSELKILRDNSQLIPGMLYHIIDYNTTTIQEGTQSANNIFDIIVTADSENTLNENARAIQSNNYNEQEYNGKLENDFFVKWDIKNEPITGVATICIYKTDVAGLDPDSENFDDSYYGADYTDMFFYKGNYEYNGENFDVWLKYEDNDNYYRIEDRFHYYLTTPIVENGLIKPELYDSNTLLFNEPFTAEYNLTIDNNNYFLNSNFNAWELKYSLDNDTTRFAWADTENGKGVIYYMKDEYGNECPYDFKNIQFERTALWFSEHEDWCNNTIGYVPNISIYYYTFTYVDENENIYDASIIGNTLYNDEGYIVGVYDNVIKDCNSFLLYKGQSDSLFVLPDNIFYTTGYSGDYYGCHSNTFGNNCFNNSFGNRCSSNTFLNGCNNNSFGEYCEGNSFGNSCVFNLFGNYYHYNSFGNRCSYNIISYTNAVLYKNIKASVHDYVRYNTFDNGCSFNNIYHQETGEYLQNYHITAGVKGEGTNSMNVIVLSQHSIDSPFKTTIAKRSDGNIVIYNEADLVPWTYITE